jgi:hypothetical protein
MTMWASSSRAGYIAKAAPSLDTEQASAPRAVDVRGTGPAGSLRWP